LRLGGRRNGGQQGQTCRLEKMAAGEVHERDENQTPRGAVPFDVSL
jgi:hypothetical protein